MRLALGALLALVLAAPAAAQAPPADESPIVGSGSFNSAPILQPGKYRDTVLPAEYLYYAVKVSPARSCTSAATAIWGTPTCCTSGSRPSYMTILSPTRMNADPFGSGEVQGDIGGTPGADFVGPETPATDDDDNQGPWSGAGIYFISVQAVWRGSTAEPPKVEIPFHFEIALDGTATARQAPAATATPKPSATATPSASPGGGKQKDNGAAVAAGVGVGGLLIGVIAGIALRRNRR